MLESLIDLNQLRIIGFSLPIADSYIKYLLKASVINTDDLKKIDILCLDSGGGIRERYTSFIKHRL